MATGIVSIALLLDHERELARIWLGATCALWLGLWVAIAIGLSGDRAALRAQARHPSGLAAVAATGVLGSGAELGGLALEAMLLLGGAAAAWLVLSIALARHRWLPRTGSAFMLTVAVQALAALAALLASRAHGTWLCYPALGLCALGLALYPIALARFDLSELVRGAGDHWIAGGALAISSLSSCEVSSALRRAGALHAIRSILQKLGAVTWGVSLGWLAVLIACELVSVRLRYHPRRWSTMFPVGMYAASGFVVARVARLTAARSFASFWTWVGVALWLTLAVASARRAH